MLYPEVYEPGDVLYIEDNRYIVTSRFSMSEMRNAFETSGQHSGSQYLVSQGFIQEIDEED